MKVTFVYAGAESLGIEYLSASLKAKGHETSLAFDPVLFNDQYQLNVPFLKNIFDRRQKVLADILSAEPDLIAFSVVTDLYRWATDLSRELKKRSRVPIIYGGIHPTSIPEEVIKNELVDYVIVGEGEDALAELADALEKKGMLEGIENLWFKRNGQILTNPVRSLVQDLDKIPFPDKALFENSVAVDDSYLIMTGRGCPFECTFCCNNILRRLYSGKGRYLRRRTPGNVIEELSLMKKKYGFREVVFCDDIFTIGRNWLRSFLGEYREKIDLPFRCLGHPQFFDREIAMMLKGSGCRRVRLSAQSMVEDNRRNILKRFETNAQIESAFQMCDEIKMPYTADHLLGIPTEAEVDYRQAAEVYGRTRCLGKIKCYYLTYFPGTEIMEFARKQDILGEEDIRVIEEGGGRMYYDGSLTLERNRAAWLMARNFEVFFKTIPVLPHFLRNLILEKRLYRLFCHLPRLVVMLIDLVVGIARRDTAAVPYLKYYLRHILGRRH